VLLANNVTFWLPIRRRHCRLHRKHVLFILQKLWTKRERTFEFKLFWNLVKLDLLPDESRLLAPRVAPRYKTALCAKDSWKQTCLNPSLYRICINVNRCIELNSRIVCVTGCRCDTKFTELQSESSLTRSGTLHSSVAFCRSELVLHFHLCTSSVNVHLPSLLCSKFRYIFSLITHTQMHKLLAKRFPVTLSAFQLQRVPFRAGNCLLPACVQFMILLLCLLFVSLSGSLRSVCFCCAVAPRYAVGQIAICFITYNSTSWGILENLSEIMMEYLIFKERIICKDVNHRRSMCLVMHV
jgi:hypothetical protein